MRISSPGDCLHKILLQCLNVRSSTVSTGSVSRMHDKHVPVYMRMHGMLVRTLPSRACVDKNTMGCLVSPRSIFRRLAK
jgi:hypothetical protein